MLRIIAGNLKGRRLQTLPGSEVRPTADRVREALFSILGRKPMGATVLDLFSGSGALGIEAISRGAHYALFVDKNPDVIALLRKNIKTCRIETCTQVARWDVCENMTGLSRFGPVFNLVFMDPPYRRELVQPVLARLTQAGLLASNALIVVEHAPEEMIRPAVVGLLLEDQRRYGRTCISFLTVLPVVASVDIPC